MATLSLPGLMIGLPVWLFSTSIVQNTVAPEQSSHQLNGTRVTPQSSTSSNSSSPPSSSLDEAGKAQTQVTEKKKEPKAKGATRHHLVKIHTLHQPGLNHHVSFAKETTIIEISLASLGS